MPEVNSHEHIGGRVYRFINLLPLFAIPDESQPQPIVLLEQLCDNLREQRGVEPFLDLKHDRLVVVVRIREILFEEPALDWRQRYRPRDSLLLSVDLRRSCGYGCKLSDR